MKNKKKLISRIAILLIVIAFCLLGVLFTIKSKMNAKENVAERSTEDSIQEEMAQNVIANELLEDFSNMEIAEAVTEEIEEQQPEVTNNQQTETSQVTASNTNDNKNKTASVTQKQTQASTQVSTQKQQATAVQSSTSTPIEQTTTTQTQAQSTKVEGEKFVRNDTMINTIKNVINNNQSDNMKTYGYTIQVDPSIKTKTNQFTFAESRVINFIKYSFGTIRVYAEDYYNNGQFIMTECYIF